MTQYTVTDSAKNILTNFAGISKSVLLRAGTEQRTVSPTDSVLATAELPTAWPQDTAIYQLADLLANITAYTKPVLEFEESQFIIRGANSPSHVEYPYSDPSVVRTPPVKTLPLTDPVAVFTLPAAAFAEIKKFAAINSLPTLSIDVDPAAQTLIVKPYDDKNPSSRTYSYPVHTQPNLIHSMTGGKHNVRINIDHFTMLMDGAYTVTVGTWPYVHFKHGSEPIAYHVVRQIVKK